MQFKKPFLSTFHLNFQDLITSYPGLMKHKMKLRKYLYDKATQTGSHLDCCNYKQARNEVNSQLETLQCNNSSKG